MDDLECVDAMNEKSLYYSMLFYFLKQSNLRLEKREENAAWFRDENNTIFVLERNEFPWKKQYIERTQKFIAELLEKYGGKLQPKEVIRMTFTTRVPYEYTDLKDIVRFKNGQMRHYIISEKISKEKYEEIGPEIFGLKEQNQYISDVEEIEAEFQDILITEQVPPEPVEKKKSFYLGKKAIINPLLIVLIVLSFVFWQKMEEDVIQLIDLGAKFNPLIQEGEWWRLITPVFLHSGFMHLGMNMLAMYYIGQDVERFYGKWRYIIIFLLSAIGGTIASYIFTVEVSVGASGAVFGLFGALLYLCQYYKDIISPSYRKNMFILVGFNLVFGVIVPGIDLMAHIGGFILGYMTSYALNFPNNHATMKRAAVGILTIVLLCGGYAYGYVKNSDNPENSWRAGEYYLEKNNYLDANTYFQKSVTNGYEETEQVHFMLGYTEVQLGAYDQSIESFKKVLEENPDNKEAQLNLVLLYEIKAQYGEALSYLEKLLAIYPKNQEYLILQKQLLMKLEGNVQ